MEQQYKLRLEKNEEEVSGRYDILLDDMTIGYIDQSGNTLVKIELHEKQRGKGYGKKAVKQWIEENRNDYRILETTSVIDHRMAKIVQSLGFKEIDDTSKFVKSV